MRGNTPQTCATFAPHSACKTPPLTPKADLIQAAIARAADPEKSMHPCHCSGGPRSRLPAMRKTVRRATRNVQCRRACVRESCSQASGLPVKLRSYCTPSFPDAGSGAGNKFDSNTGVWRTTPAPQNVRCSKHGMRPVWAINLLPDPRGVDHVGQGHSGAHCIHCTSRRWVSLHLLVHLRAHPDPVPGRLLLPTQVLPVPLSPQYLRRQ